MELTVKEFSELMGLMLEARSARAGTREVTPVPLSAQSGTRVVVDTAEIQRVVAESLDLERKAIALLLGDYAASLPEDLRKAVQGAVEMVQQRVGRR